MWCTKDVHENWCFIKNLHTPITYSRMTTWIFDVTCVLDMARGAFCSCSSNVTSRFINLTSTSSLFILLQLSPFPCCCKIVFLEIGADEHFIQRHYVYLSIFHKILMRLEFRSFRIEGIRWYMWLQVKFSRDNDLTTDGEIQYCENLFWPAGFVESTSCFFYWKSLLKLIWHCRALIKLDLLIWVAKRLHKTRSLLSKLSQRNPGFQTYFKQQKETFRKKERYILHLLRALKISR